jgi:type I restriction enzyme, R subunit
VALHNEDKFEDDICEYLAGHGWLYSKNDSGYDAERAIFPEDLFSWIEDTQNEAWKRIKGFHNGSTQTVFMDRLVKLLESDGALSVLRHGFKVAGAGASRFELCQFKPSHGFNEEVAKRYGKNRLRVMRQVHYSTHSNTSLDLVFFVNGIPVATAELKTDFTQSVEKAKRQYRKDRLPKDPVTKHTEPLLTFKRGALVHFAISTDEIYMTTELKGDGTYFLPFNLGRNGGAGNPTNPNGYDTDYLWKRILAPDNWLDILGSFMHLEREEKIGKDGKRTTKETMIFPRFHQFDAVTALVMDAKANGVGLNKLIQHSAGSGKTNTIGWTAHKYATLHDDNDQKIFDSVIVITDRTVLDDQLQETIDQFQKTPGVVRRIDGREGSKKNQLAKALQDGAMIIVVTLQSFTYILEEMRGTVDMAKRHFAVLIDEAHSSQSGASARKVRQALTLTGDEAEEMTAEDFLLEESKARKLPPNVTFVAFTATPKQKTIEVFGTLPHPSEPRSATNIPRPFHHYSMRQAVDEGFILDVLKNYTPYRLAYRLAHGGKDYDDKEVDKSAALKTIARWVRLHPYNIGQKVEVIVEHFKGTVLPRFPWGKAMVVTGSRKEAVRYKRQMDSYLKEAGYKGLACLVAFSGEVIDEDFGTEKFTETSMNPSLKGSDIREGLDGDEYQVLIVANKFQTGFDQPKLVAMYVDKRLAGISAVQTLSRLNRRYPGKETTYVLDFVNKPEEIKDAFAPYYETTELAGTSDPNLIYDLQTKLDVEGIYTEAEVVAVTNIYFGKKVSQEELIKALAPAVGRFKTKWLAALNAKDAKERDRLELFQRNMGSFGRIYDFLSQIIDYGDTDLERRYWFYRLLAPLVRPENINEEIDVSALKLTHYRLRAQDATHIVLGEPDGDYKLPPISEVGTGKAREPTKTQLAALIEKLNDLFEGDGLSDADRVGIFEHAKGKLLESKDLEIQAKANSKEQFASSPEFERVLIDSLISALDNYQSMGNRLLSDAKTRERFANLLVGPVYDGLRSGQTGQQPMG